MPTPPEATAELTLEDRHAIVAATIKYCWAIDGRAYDELDDVFVEDVAIDYGTIAPAFTGRDPLKKLIASALDPLDRSHHMVSNHEIEVVDGQPRSRCYFHAQHVRKVDEGSPNYIVAGIYHDRWVKLEAGWRSCARELEVVWTDGNPAVIGA